MPSLDLHLYFHVAPATPKDPPSPVPHAATGWELAGAILIGLVVAGAMVACNPWAWPDSWRQKD